jgi:peroxiredoxin
VSGPSRKRGRRRLLVALEIGLMLIIVWSIYLWRATDLLPADGVTPAPSFELQDLAGRTWTLDDFRDKPTVLYFFAPWCAVCNASAHQLRWFQRLFGDDVDLVMVALEYVDADAVREYRSSHGLQNVILLGDDATARDYRVQGFPIYYVLDETGGIRRRDFGFSTIPGLWWRACVAVR